MKSHCAAAFYSSLLCGLAACQGQPQTLGGTVGNGSLDLQVTDQRAYWTGQSLVITFQANSNIPVGEAAGFGNPVWDQTARLQINTARQAITTGVNIPMADDIYFPAVSISHYVLHFGPLGVLDQEADFPPLNSGTMFFSSLGTKAGDALRGDFTATFSTGETLSSSFDTTLVNP